MHTKYYLKPPLPWEIPLRPNPSGFLEKAPIDKLAAEEAYYFRAHQNHKNNDYEKSNEVIALLSKNSAVSPTGP